MTDLSITAQVILATHWGFGDNTKLTMGNEKSRMTSRCREAMTELILTDIVHAEKADDSRAESMSYTLTEKGKRMDRRKSSKWMEEHGRFPFTEKVPE
jgi:hypothetical protein